VRVRGCPQSEQCGIRSAAGLFVGIAATIGRAKTTTRLREVSDVLHTSDDEITPYRALDAVGHTLEAAALPSLGHCGGTLEAQDVPTDLVWAQLSDPFQIGLNISARLARKILHEIDVDLNVARQEHIHSADSDGRIVSPEVAQQAADKALYTHADSVDASGT
jgi:hypothetical protein